MRMCILTHSYTHMCTYTCTHTHTCTHVCTYTRVRTRTHTHTHTHKTHTHMRTHTHTHIQTCTHAHTTHTHTHTPGPACWCELPCCEAGRPSGQHAAPHWVSAQRLPLPGGKHCGPAHTQTNCHIVSTAQKMARKSHPLLVLRKKWHIRAIHY